MRNASTINCVKCKAGSLDIFSTPEIAKTLSIGQVNVLKALSALIDPALTMMITSTHVDYRGVARTKANGPNHVLNQGIDVIFCNHDGEFDDVFNYSRSLLIWKFCHDIIVSLPRGMFICLEDDHMHFHCVENNGQSVVMLQSIAAKQKSNPNGSYFCEGHDKSMVKKDITKVLSFLFT